MGEISGCGAFSHDGLCALTRILASMNSAQYQFMFYDHWISIGPSLLGTNWVFQQDNVS